MCSIPRGITLPSYRRGINFSLPQTIFQAMGLRDGPYMGCIHWEYALLVAFMERCKSTTSTFHIPIGEMMITIKDIHYLYYLPIHG